MTQPVTLYTTAAEEDVAKLREHSGGVRNAKDEAEYLCHNQLKAGERETLTGWCGGGP